MCALLQQQQRLRTHPPQKRNTAVFFGARLQAARVVLDDVALELVLADRHLDADAAALGEAGDDGDGRLDEHEVRGLGQVEEGLALVAVGVGAVLCGVFCVVGCVFCV